MRLVETSTFDELDLEVDGIKLTLRRTGAGGEGARGLVKAANAVSQDAQTTTAGAAGPRAAPGPVVAPGLNDARVAAITSPMLGTFYRAPKPGAPPFVEIGSHVDEDSVIAIIEVMKLMNTVRAGVKGVITEIIPKDEALVEFGEVLMRARRDA